MSIKFKSYNALSLKETLNLLNLTIATKFVSYEGKEYYSQIFLDECL